MSSLQIHGRITALGHCPEYVRLIKDKATGTSKGVAILKFKSVETAAACIEAHAVVDVDDGPVWLEFGFEHTSDDWHCRTCNSLNFHFRPQCFKCGTSKAPRVDKTTSSTSSTPSNFLNDGSEDVCPTPTKFLLIRGLDAMLDAQMLFEKLSVVDSEIVHVWLVRDRQTLRSRCFAFVQFSAVGVMAKPAEGYINRLHAHNVAFQIDGQPVKLSYGRDLESLSRLFSHAPDSIHYWDPLCELSVFPPLSDCAQGSGIAAVPDKTSLTDTGKRTATAAIPSLSQSVPTKKVQIQLKQWTAKASESDEQRISEQEPRFVPSSTSTSMSVSGTDGESTIAAKFVDQVLLVCFLCQRQFADGAALLRHTQDSALHAANFDSYMKRAAETELTQARARDPSAIAQYRDRAAERRDTFGEDEQEVQRLREQREQRRLQRQDKGVKPPIASAEALTSEYSVGAKLLRKMGWKEGEGLGREGSGIVEPIKAVTLEQAGAGLGSSSVVTADSIAPKTYVDRVRSAQRKRFEQSE